MIQSGGKSGRRGPRSEQARAGPIRRPSRLRYPGRRRRAGQRDPAGAVASSPRARSRRYRRSGSRRATRSDWSRPSVVGDVGLPRAIGPNREDLVRRAHLLHVQHGTADQLEAGIRGDAGRDRHGLRCGEAARTGLGIGPTVHHPNCRPPPPGRRRDRRSAQAGPPSGSDNDVRGQVIGARVFQSLRQRAGLSRRAVNG